MLPSSNSTTPTRPEAASLRGGPAHPASEPSRRMDSVSAIPKRKPLKPVYVKKARTLITENQLADDGSS